ncbi:MAG: hydroxymethylglutaryl-CoA lyase, partial [Bacteroidota bacterium]
MIQLIECPRDAMQGMENFIPTQTKVDYINRLLQVGFDTIDFGSFVSPKTIPQMKDTAQVLSQLQLSSTTSQLLAIIANVRGAEEACRFEEIAYLGFPLSVSETFQQRNTRKSIQEALETVIHIQRLCSQHKKQQVVYLSMGFGNPYEEPYSPDIVAQLVEKLVAEGISIVALSDTIGVATPDTIQNLYTTLQPSFPTVTFGAHLHSPAMSSKEKIQAAYEAGCRRFDGAIRGFGGCPMAKDELTGNIATETIVAVLEEKEVLPTTFQKASFQEA